MPAPAIERVSGYPGFPVDGRAPELKQGFKYFNEEIRPRREYVFNVRLSLGIFQFLV